MDIQNTGLTFRPGQTLKTSDLNTINNTLNELVDAVNILRRGFFDVNQETGCSDPLSLVEAIESTTRRSVGMKIRFLGLNGKYLEYSYTGIGVGDADWTNLDNWSSGGVEIDGGTW